MAAAFTRCLVSGAPHARLACAYARAEWRGSGCCGCRKAGVRVVISIADPLAVDVRVGSRFFYVMGKGNPMLKRILLPLLVVALMTACSKKEEPAPAAPEAAPQTSAPAEVTPAATAPEAPAATTSAAPAATTAGGDLAAGESVYKKTCFICHGTGAGGAPMISAKAEWEPRIAQGKDTLYKHAIEGLTGEKGMMPPRGGNLALSDDEVKSAVDYMLSQIK